MRKSYARRYEQIVQRIRNKLKNKEEKVRVCFLATEDCKWNYHYLYLAMKEDPMFDPVVVYAPRTTPFFHKADIYERNLDFFRKRYPDLVMGYDSDKKKYIDLQTYQPDVIFYTEPWDIHATHQIEQVSRFALTCYVPYPLAESPETLVVNLKKFHYFLFRHFIITKSIKKQYKNELKYTDSALSVVGHPKLDAYLDQSETKKEKPYVIYSPHCSVPQRSWSKMSTFEWTGRHILEYAKKHPEFNWVFKPHPDVYRVMIMNKIMTENEMKAYFKAWDEIGQCYTTGDYFHLFKNSRCLITDCISFLGEYLPSGKPVIHLRSKYGVNYSAINKDIIDHYYQAWDLDQLDKHLKEILEEGKDPMKEERLECQRKLGLGTSSAAHNIIRELKASFRVK